jgi:MoaA/NifB/PqqE/SkfB family radical SAM enzyme
MHQKEKLTQEELIRIVQQYQDYGTTQVQLGGGEPLLRIKDVYAILDHARPGTDFWITTSGWRFTKDQAITLKTKGLTGIMVSLDHHLPEPHDQFRGRTGAYQMAIQAALLAKEVGLVTGLSLCPTRAYTNEANLIAYLELARQLGVTFVQFFEPKPSGRYQGQDVLLSDAQLALLDRFYFQYNQDSRYRDYPIINYIGYHQRKLGCFGSGDYYLYVDTDGDVHNCPLCETKVCHALAFPVEDTVKLLQQTKGCHFFANADRRDV